MKELEPKLLKIMSVIKVNGNVQEVVLPETILDIIRANNVLQPEMVSVQRNGEFVLKEHYSITQVQDGDEVDFLYFMGGGSLPLSYA
jgi:sulfur carrier protein